MEVLVPNPGMNGKLPEMQSGKPRTSVVENMCQLPKIGSMTQSSVVLLCTLGRHARVYKTNVH